MVLQHRAVRWAARCRAARRLQQKCMEHSWSTACSGWCTWPMSPRGGYNPSETSAVCSRCMRSGRVHGQGFAGGRKAQRAELGGSCKGSWAGQGGNTQIEAQCIPTSHGRSIADANALPGVLHAIAQRRPRAHFRAGDDTAELAILPPPRDRDRSRVAALYVGKLSLLGGLSLMTMTLSPSHLYTHIPN